jgi:hypothetical protein
VIASLAYRLPGSRYELFHLVFFIIFSLVASKPQYIHQRTPGPVASIQQSLAEIPRPGPAFPDQEKGSGARSDERKLKELLHAYVTIANGKFVSQNAMAPAFADLGSDFQPAAHLATAIHNAVIKDYLTTRDVNATYTAKATLALIAENGTILSKVYIDAPLVPKETLEKQLFLQKLTQAPTFAIEFFNGTLPTVRL